MRLEVVCVKPDGNRGKRLVDRAIEAFDLPGEVLAGLPKLTLTGDRQIHIECHRGLLEYDGSLIAVNGGPVLIKIRGEGLEICSMNSEELLIRGRISSIELE